MSSIDEEVSLQVEEELKRRKEEEEKKAVEAITTYPVVKIKEGASISDVAASIGEKPGSAVKILMSEGLLRSLRRLPQTKGYLRSSEKDSRNILYSERRRNKRPLKRSMSIRQKKAEKHASAKKGEAGRRKLLPKILQTSLQASDNYRHGPCRPR